MSTHQVEELDRYPKYKKAYISAFDRMLKRRTGTDKTYEKNWETGEDVFDWWTGLGSGGGRNTNK